MQKKILPWFILITLFAITLLVFVTQMLGFDLGVCAAISKSFFYAIVIEIVDNIFDKKDGSVAVIYPLIFIITILGTIVLTSIIVIDIERIFNLDLGVRSFSAYIAVFIGYFLGLGFFRLFKKKLFIENNN